MSTEESAPGTPTIRGMISGKTAGLQVARGFTAIGLAAILMAATPPPPGPPQGAPGGGTSAPVSADSPQLQADARRADANVARESALLAALHAVNGMGVSRINAAVGALGLVTTTDRGQLTSQLTAIDAQGPALLSALRGDNAQLNPDVETVLGALGGADFAAIAKGSTISVDPESYVRALDDLSLRDGRPSPNGGPPNLAAIAAALPAIMANSVPPPPPSASAAPSSSPGDQGGSGGGPQTASTDASTALLAAVIAAGAVVLVLIAVLLWRARRDKPGVAPPAPTAAASRIAELLDVSRRLTAVSATGEMDRAVVREALGIVPAHAAALVRRIDGAYTIAQESQPGLLVPDRLGEGIVERVAETGQPVAQVSATEPSLHSLPAAIAAVPLVSSGAVQAVLVLVRSATEPFTSDERELLIALAPMAAAALYTAGRAKAAVEDSLIDPLTGVGNRRRMDAELTDLLQSASGNATSLIMVDLDHFKSVNDTHGHPAGDALLRAVVGVIRETVRPGDRVYRFGGEEFCVVLPQTAASDAADVAERVRQTMAALPFTLDGGLVLSASASFGVAQADNADGADLLKRADAALYGAKNSGRNTVRVG